MILSILLLIAVVSLILYFFGPLLVKPKRKLPPGPIIWPIVGNVIELAAMDSKYPHLALAKFAKKYGNIVGFGFGSRYSVLVSGFEEIREIFRKPETFEYRFISSSVEDRNFNKLLGIVFNGGPAWREIRSFTIRSLRNYGVGKRTSMEVLISEVSEVLVQDIQENALANDGVWNVDIHHLAASVLNVIWGIIAGYRVNAKDPVVLNLIRFGEEIVDIISQNNIYNTFPALKRWFPKLVKHDVHLKTHAMHHAFIRELISEVKRLRALRPDTSAQNLIESFVDEIDKNRGKESHYTEEQLIVTMLDLFLASSETSSMVISWVILFLTLNKKCQSKLKQEIEEVRAEQGDSVPLEVASKLSYLNAVIFEAIRLGLGIPVPPPRLASEDIYYKDIVIPKGTVLIANMTLVFMDENFWGDPKVFRPERFLDVSGQLIPQLTDRVEVFGYGNRKCIGDKIAWDTVMLFLTAILGTFSFEPISGNEPSAESPISSVTVRPRPFSVRVLKN